MRRARSDDQKQARRRAILDAARAACVGEPPVLASMDALAAEAGVAKGTLYLYFRTREEVYLALLQEDMVGWFAELLELATALPAPAALAPALVGSLGSRPLMTGLLAELPTILEANVEAGTIREFKRWVHGRQRAFGAALETALPASPEGEGERFCLRVFALLIGLYQLAHPAPIVRRAFLDEPDAAMLAIDFGAELEAGIAALVGGLGS